MNWILKIDKKAIKKVKRFPKKDIQKIYGAISSTAINPFHGDIQKMAGEKNVWRRRVGSYRIFYEFFPSEKIILVFKVKRRSSHTY
jgi:mRNA interferase RelE/StbE